MQTNLSTVYALFSNIFEKYLNASNESKLRFSNLVLVLSRAKPLASVKTHPHSIEPNEMYPIFMAN
jgi:hypothetical protein